MILNKHCIIIFFIVLYNCRNLRNNGLTSVRVEDLVNYTSLEIMSVGFMARLIF